MIIEIIQLVLLIGIIIISSSNEFLYDRVFNSIEYFNAVSFIQNKLICLNLGILNNPVDKL